MDLGLSGRTAIVRRESAQSRPSESLISTSQTQVVRPRCLATASASTTPEKTGRRNEESFDCPKAPISGPTLS